MPISDLLAAQLGKYAYTDLNEYKVNGLAINRFKVGGETGELPSGWVVNTALSNKSENGIEQFLVFANTTDPNHKQVVIAFQGTDPTNLTTQVKSDLLDAGKVSWDQIKGEADDALEDIRANYAGAEIMTTGHSLGGGMAQTFALLNNLSGYAQNSLPIGQQTIMSEDFPALDDDGHYRTFRTMKENWAAAGNTFSEVYVSGDVATEWFKKTLGGEYLDDNPDVLPSPYPVAQLILGEFFPLIAFATAIGAHSYDHVIDRLTHETGSLVQFTEAQAAALKKELDAVQSITFQGNSTVHTRTDGTAFTISPVSGGVQSVLALSSLPSGTSLYFDATSALGFTVQSNEYVGEERANIYDSATESWIELQRGTGAGVGIVTLPDGTVINVGGSGNVKLASIYTSSGSASQALVNFLGDVGVNMTFQQLSDLHEAQLHSGPVTPFTLTGNPQWVNPDGKISVFYNRSSRPPGITATGLQTATLGSQTAQAYNVLFNAAPSNSILDMTKDNISNFQELDILGFGYSLTAAQFNSFQFISGNGEIFAATGGTYSLAGGRDLHQASINLTAQSWDGTTLVASDRADNLRERLKASLFGNDTLVAGAVGSDLIGGLGVNQITGGVGQDYIEFSGKVASGSSINGGGAEDTLALRNGGDISSAAVSNVEKLQAVGTAGKTITLTAQQLAGFSTLVGAMTLQGVNAGTYSLAGKTYSTGQIDFIGSDGNDRIDYNGFKSVEGGGGFDTLVLSGSSNYTIDLGSTTNQVVGSSYATTGFENVDGSALTGTLTFQGNDSSNEIAGSAGAGSIYGYGGNDRITYDTLDSLIDGGSGSDTLVLAGSASRTVNLGNTSDQVTGGGTTKGFENVDGSIATGSLTITGDANANVLKGGSAADSINGGGGDDTITYTANDTLIDGGTGNDTLVVVVGTEVDLASTTDQVLGDSGTTRGFEAVSYISDGNPNTLIGDSNGNFFGTKIGPNNIFGLGGDDGIAYDAADGIVDGGTGIDRLLIGGSAALTINLANTADQVTGGGIARNFEDVIATGTTGVLSITGDANANKLEGGFATDFLYGGGGDDSIDYRSNDVVTDGGSGNDTLTGGIYSGLSVIDLSNASDQVSGGGTTTGFENVDLSGIFIDPTLPVLSVIIDGSSGVNTLIGGAGNDALGGLGGADYLYGGAGNDLVDYRSDDVITDGGSGSDWLQGDDNSGLSIINLFNANDQVVGGGTATGFENVNISWIANAANGIIINGDSAANSVIGGAGNDTIDGRGGADSLSGRGGNDTITYNASAALIDGGAGDDTLIVAAGTVVDLNSTTDQVAGDAGITLGFEHVTIASSSTINGDAGNNTLAGTAAAEDIFGLGGNDTITYDVADGTVDGGTGNDTLVVLTGLTANLANTADQVTGGGTTVSFENIDGSGTNSGLSLTGDANANILKAGGAWDTLVGGAGADSLYGNGGNDGITYDAADVIADGGAGIDTLKIGGTTAITANLANSTDQVIGGGSAINFENIDASTATATMNFTGSSAANILKGGSGADIIVGGGGTDSLYGNGGDDTITYDAAATLIDGGAGDDTLVVAAGTVVDLNSATDQVAGDAGITIGFEHVMISGGGGGGSTINGDAGDNIIPGAAGAQDIFGLGGNDTITYDAADGTVDGGSGVDTLLVNTALTANLANAGDQVSAGGVTINFENIDASSATAAVSLTGDANANTLEGGTGADTLVGAAGADSLFGSGGNDTVTYDVNDATIDGGSGNDTLVLEGAGVSVNLANADQVTGGGTASGFENVDGSSLGSGLSLTGDANGNVLKAGGAWDTLVGGAGADSLYGNGGNDAITYDAADVIADGGAGVDTLKISGTTAITANLASGADQVTGGGTTINFENIDASAAGAAMNLTGNSAANTLKGGADDDIIVGGGGADSLYGNGGDDTITYDANAVLVDGGSGDDTLVVAAGTVVDLNSTTDQIAGDAGITLGFEHVSIAGGGGGSTINGDAGNNTLTGTAAAEDIFGLGGNDTITYDVADSTVDGGTGNDTLVVLLGLTANLANTADQVTGGGTTVNFENIDGSGTNSGLSLTGDANANILKAGGAWDTVAGGAGADSLYGMNGNDGITYDAADVIADGGAGVDTLKIGGATAITANLANSTDQVTGGGTTINFESIDASTATAAMSFTGGTETNSIKGGSAGDTIVGGGGADSLYGNGGDDTLTYHADAVLIDGGSGDDTLLVAAGTVVDLNNTTDQIAGDAGITFGFEHVSIVGGGGSTINGDAGNNTLAGTAAAEDIFGLGGNDIITYDIADGTVDGGTGNDTLVLTASGGLTVNLANSADQVTGGGTAINFENVDASAMTSGLSLTGDANANILKAGGAWDALVGGAGTDSLYGNDGNDTITYDAIDLLADGGIGSDTLKITGATAIAVNLANVADQVTGGGTTTNFENVDGSSATASLTLTGDAGANVLKGSFAGDVLNGGGGADSLYGNAGDDELYSLGIASALYGGDGDDVIKVDIDSVIAAGRVLDGGNGYDVLSANYDVLSFAGATVTNFEELQMSSLALMSEGQLDQFTALVAGGGAAGNFTIAALEAGFYTLSGKTIVGNITLSGSSGADVLGGTVGNETLQGNGGNDSLNGYAGNDTYKFARGDGADTIFENDATAGNSDRLSFYSGVARDQLWFSRSGNNLDISIIGTTDKVAINDWYLGTAQQVESIRAGSMELNNTSVANLVSAMASLTPPPFGQTNLTAAQHTQLDSVIAANWHSV